MGVILASFPKTPPSDDEPRQRNQHKGTQKRDGSVDIVTLQLPRIDIVGWQKRLVFWGAESIIGTIFRPGSGYTLITMKDHGTCPKRLLKNQ